jgi:hypothetical protein
MKGFLSAVTLLALASCGGGSPPDDLRPRIIESHERLSRQVVVIDKMTNLIRDLAICNGNIIATGGTNSCTLTATSQAQCVSFRLNLEDAYAVVKPTTCGRTFIGFERNGGPVVALDDAGKELWTRSFGAAPGPIAVVHDADKTLVAIVIGRSKLALVDLNSSATIREIAGEFSGFIGAGNLAGSASDEIVTAPSSGIDIRRSDGTIVSHLQLDGSSAVTRSSTGRAHIVTLSQRGLLLMSGENEVTVPLALPNLPSVGLMHVVASAEFADARYIATLIGGRGGWHRTLLLVHNNRGQLLHAEILSDDYVSAVPDEIGGARAFLIGGRGKIVRFSAP